MSVVNISHCPFPASISNRLVNTWRRSAYRYFYRQARAGVVDGTGDSDIGSLGASHAANTEIGNKEKAEYDGKH